MNYDLNKLNELSLNDLLDLYAYGYDLEGGEICLGKEDEEEGRMIMDKVKQELSERMSH